MDLFGTKRISAKLASRKFWIIIQHDNDIKLQRKDFWGYDKEIKKK